MVYKIRFTVFLLIIFVLVFLSLILKGNTETNLLKTFLPKSVAESTFIVSIADKTSSNIKVVFEGQTEKLKEDFIKQVNKDYFELTEYNTKELVNNYLKSPMNFLSPKTRVLLKEKRYDEIFEKSFLSLLDPAGIQRSPLDKDPYLFLDGFLLSNRLEAFGVSDSDNKNYDYITLKMKNNEGLLPNLSNKKIKDLVKIQNELTKGENKIYLAGNPIHSYYTSEKSIISIKLICLLSVLLIIFLTNFYFRKTALLIPVVLGIIGGLLAGYVVTKALFEDFQIVTMVFSTTLIGIGIDYSYHYFFSKNIDKNFIKKLSFSIVITIVPFIILFFAGIEILRQISVFIVSGLAITYLTVLFIYPFFNKPEPVKSIQINIKPIKILLIVLCVLSIVGFARTKFNDSLTAFYIPNKKLARAEKLYNQLSGKDYSEVQYITVTGDNIKDIIKKEEEITSKLDEKSVEYISLSSLVPSVERQKENFDLVKELYKNNLYKYSDILSNAQIQRLKSQIFTPIWFNIQKYPYLNEFMADEKTSVIFVFSDKNLDLGNTVNVKSDIKKYIKEYREKLTIIFLPVFLILMSLILKLYGKNGVKLIIPSILGLICSAGLTLLFTGELNVFSIIALYMLFGFTVDHSIFRYGGEKESEDAIFVSVLSTAIPFLMLSFCGFKLLNTISLTLFFGIVISYLVGEIVFKNSKD